MPFTWVLNLDAELELARPGYNRGAKINAQLATFVEAARQRLLGSDDRIAGEAPADHGASIGRAWCPTPQAVARLLQVGATPEPHPSSELLRRVNHRRFARELGAGPPGAIFVDTAAQLDRALSQMDGPWLLKRPLSFAGRGQLRLRAEISAAEQSWIDASLAEDGLALEPLLEPLTEYSLHGFLWRDGHYELGRPCVQVTEHGAFQLARLAEASDLGPAEQHELLARGAEVADALAHLNYFGPFGIDAYCYRRGAAEAVSFCALSEINARYTMAFNVGFPTHPSELTLD